MDDAMIDLMAGDAQLRRRLEAFADARLSPDPAATSRIRARVMATAHRQAALARADASLTVVPPVPDAAWSGRAPAAPPVQTRDRKRPAPWRRVAAIVLAASLGVALFGGTALAARPGGPLYETRLWVETLTLPSDPSARAIAEVRRLDDRLAEAAAATRAGDGDAAAAALSAYATIVDDASTRALLDGNPVASAALEAGVTRNLEVLTALATRVPDQASSGISRAIERAIVHSDAAVDTIHGRGPAGGSGGDGSGGTGGSGSGGNGGAGGTGGNGGNGNGNGGDGVTGTPGPQGPTATPEPTQKPQPTKGPDAKPTKAPTPEPVTEPTRTPRPAKSPPGGGRPSQPPAGGNGGGG